MKGIINEQMQIKDVKKRVLRYPRLDTVLMVEEFIRENSGEFSKKQIWENLPKKTMYQTFSTILDYLEYSNKIASDKNRKIVWIWNPELVKKYLSDETLSR